MSARERDPTRNGIRLSATALCRWQRTPEGSLRATWRPGWRVAPGGNATEHNPDVRLTRAGRHVRAASSSTGNARQRLIDRWIPGGFIAALYVLIVFVEIAIVVRA